MHSPGIHTFALQLPDACVRRIRRIHLTIVVSTCLICLATVLKDYKRQLHHSEAHGYWMLFAVWIEGCILQVEAGHTWNFTVRSVNM
ncbi:hypothetical protein BJV82DRAFT_624009, partial [Fennellomyces sp. T-0311]